jgi:solute carrier family 25 protein 16
MESRGPAKLLEEPLSRATDQGIYADTDALPVKVEPAPQGKKELDKKSLDYVLRSGLAGGLAGCAVGHWLL